VLNHSILNNINNSGAFSMARTSTMKGKQNVHYYQISDEGLNVLVNLPKAALILLVQIIQDSDKKDNCCQLSPKQLIDKYELNHSNAYSQIRKLKSVDFLKDAEDIFGIVRLMVNPIWVTWQNRGLVRFTILMYALGSHDLTVKHLDLEDMCRGRIDINTGEHFDWFGSGLERADQHYGLKPDTRYEYVSTGNLPFLNTSQKVQRLTNSRSIKTSNMANTVLQFSEDNTYQEDDSHEEYDDSLSYRRAKPAILSIKDVISCVV
jgi:hypothetical protein